MRRSVVRRRRLGSGWTARLVLRLLDAVGEIGDLPGQEIDLLPLRHDGLVEILDGLVLVGDTDLQRVDAGAQGVMVTHRTRRPPSVAQPREAPPGHGRGPRARRTRSTRPASGSRLP